MKKWGKAVSFIMAASLVVASLTACSGSGETTADTTAAGETSAAAGTETFLIGGIGPLTGSAASYGISVEQGAQVAIDEINAAGGVKVGDTTYMLDMVFEDDEATEDKAIQAYNTVMDEGAQVIMGAVTSGACIAITPLTLQDGILQITPSGSAEACIANDNAFRICFSDPEQGRAMADYAIDSLGYTKIAVLYNNSDEYSTGLQTAFEEEVKAKGGEIVASESFNTQLSSIRSTDAEVIYVPAYYQAATYISNQAKEMGMEIPFIGSDGWDGVLGTVTDASTVEGAIFSSPFCASVDDERVQNFVKAYGEANDGAVPDQFAADAYDTVYTIKAAMEQAGSIESEDMIAAMTEITVNGLTGDAITFDASGAAKKDVRFVEIVDGAYQYREE